MLPFGGKPNRKNITVPAFSGRVSGDDFDAGARRWWNEFTDQVEGAQHLEGRQWTEDQKLTILQSSLTGDAANWFREYKGRQDITSLEQAGKQLVKRFRSQLREQDIRAAIAVAGKRRSETYSEYADRLLSMVDALPGGTAIDMNVRAALSTFVDRAYPKFGQSLFEKSISIRGRAADKLRRLVVHLTSIARSDGKLDQKSAFDPKRVKLNNGQASSSDGRAMVAMVERKHKPVSTSKKPGQPSKYGPPTDSANMQCYNCRDWGHRAVECPSKRRQYNGPRATAAAAVKPESSQ
jgi:hypothetical protein